MLDALRNKLSQQMNRASDSVKEVAQDLNIIVTDEIYEHRMNLCGSCEHQHKKTKLCMLCGCYTPAKTKTAFASCPIKKWVRVEK